MIWIVIVAAVFVGGGTWFVAKSMTTRAIVLAMGAAAVAVYWFLGRPDMADRPLDVRLTEIEEMLRVSPEKLDEREAIALAQRRAHEFPDEAKPLVLVGQMYESLAARAQADGVAAMQAGREAEAGRHAASMQASLDGAAEAYNTALRRDPNDAEALINLADLRFKTTTEVDGFTTELYSAAFASRPDNFRAGYLAGIGLWLQGKKADAEALWASIDARAPQGGPERQMFAALRQMFGVDPPSAPLPGKSPN